MPSLKIYNVVLKGNAVQVMTDAELARCRHGRHRLGTIEARSKTDVYDRIHNFVKEMLELEGQKKEEWASTDAGKVVTTHYYEDDN